MTECLTSVGQEATFGPESGCPAWRNGVVGIENGILPKPDGVFSSESHSLAGRNGVVGIASGTSAQPDAAGGMARGGIADGNEAGGIELINRKKFSGADEPVSGKLALRSRSQKDFHW